MASEFYDSQLTAAQIEAALEAVDGLIAPANNGKILAIENGTLAAKSVTDYTKIIPKTITTNGTYDPADDGANGYAPVIVNTGSSAILVSKTITKNGVYDPADDDADGYDSVTVNVGSGPINFYAWKTVTVYNGNAVWGDKSVTLSSTRSDCYTEYGSGFPASAKILVTNGQTVKLEWTASSEEATLPSGRVYLFQEGGTSHMQSALASAGSVSLTANNSNTYFTFRIGVESSGHSITYSNIRYTITDPT